MLPLFSTLLLLIAPSAASFAAEGETHLQRADAAEHPLDELQLAHTSFDSAYLLDGDPRHLCRALSVAYRALRVGIFADEQERLFWQETRGDDLGRLQRDAAETGRANCRFDPTGKPFAPRVALLEGDDVPAGSPSPASDDRPSDAPEASRTLPTRTRPGSSEQRRGRAHTAAGAVFTSVGAGLLAATAGVLALERQRIAEMKGLVAAARSEGRQFTGEEHRRFEELHEDVDRGANVALGLGVAGLANLGIGVAVLATRPRPRPYAIHPYAGPQGAGAVLRLKF